MRQPRGSARYGSAYVAPVPSSNDEEGIPALAAADGGGAGGAHRRDHGPVASAGDDHVERAAVLEEYLTLARAHDGETWFDAGAWSEELADSYLALGRVDDAVATIANATRWGYAEGAEVLYELAEKLMRSAHEPQARSLWQPARSGYPDDVWICVQAGIEYSDMGGYAEALDWLTAGLELALRTGDPESALEQLRPLRASCLSALGRQPDDIQEPTAQREHR
jgi:tetratricopeptide (TPR) repeat protein